MEVSRLVRVRYHDSTLPKWLKPGKTRFFDDDVVVRLFESLELEYPAENKSKIVKSSKARSQHRQGRRK